jgi:hypothetical protein
MASRDDVATYPMSAGDPPMARTANGNATPAMAEPRYEITSQASSRRKLRLASGPHRALTPGPGRPLSTQ